MGKERYEITEIEKRYSGDFNIAILDNNHSHAIIRLENAVDVLNKQDARIKELENQVEKWKQDYENCSKLEKNLTKEHQYCLDNWRACEQENQQLIKQYDLLNKKYCEEMDKNIIFTEQLKQSQYEKAIEVLEKVRNYFVEECTDGDGIETGDLIITKDIVDVVNYVDNQLKEIRS